MCGWERLIYLERVEATGDFLAEMEDGLRKKTSISSDMGEGEHAGFFLRRLFFFS